jgi:ubiquinone/menaquinone biosynthesis C-methylase UbiE
MSTNYWKEYWANEHVASSPDPQVQVARTRMGNPIDQESWQKTLDHVVGLMEIEPGDRILDACGGNGLFAARFQELCHQVVVVDLNAELLEIIKKNTPTVDTVHSDLTAYLQNAEPEFEKILFYAGIQYFSELETFQILEKFKRILIPGGVILIGDIPNFHQRDSFLSRDGRYKRYFDNLKEGKETIGTWFTFDWLSEMTSYLGFESCTLKVQPEYQIYSDFRFDAIIRL